MRNLIPAFGAAVGIAMAVFGLAEPEPSVGGDVVARVDDRAIGRAELDSAVGAVASDLKVMPGPELRHQVLDRMIDERLLVARALELGIAETDPVLRTKLGQGVIELLTSSVQEPSSEEVGAYYRDNSARFATRPRVSLRALRFTGEGHEQRARAAAEQGWQVAVAQADSEIFVPTGPVSVSKLRDYVGSSVAEAANSVGIQVVVEHHRSTLVRVSEVVAGRVPALEVIEGNVRAAMRRERGDKALRRYLDDAREAASIRLAPEFR